MVSIEETANLLSEIIIKRDYDVPDWIYDEINTRTIIVLIERNIRTCEKGSIVWRYNNEPKVREFFDRVREKFKYKQIIPVDKFETFMEYCPILLNDDGWRLFCKESKKITKNSTLQHSSLYIDTLFNFILPFECFDDRLPEFINNTVFDKLYTLLMVNAKFGTTYLTDNTRRKKHKFMKKIIDAMDVSKNVVLVDYCLKMGIPTLFEYGDNVDLTRYLDTFIEESCHEDLDPNIMNFIDEFDSDNLDKVFIIANRLNERNFKYYIGLVEKLNLGYLKKTVLETTRLGKSVQSKTINKSDTIKDFKDLITIFGNNQYGLSINIQLDFISNGGDIKTMFDNGELLPEASIIRTQTQLKFLINNISDDDIYFLLYNSSDFVKNLMSSSDLSILDIVKCIRPLFETPINEELWNVLNNKSMSTVVDYRLTLVNKVIVSMGLDSLYNYVPESLQYIPPNALYVTRNISKDNIRYIPVEKLVPYLNSIISNSDYNTFNLYCKGEYISLEKVFRNITELTDNIIKYKKYGYICDIRTIEPKKLIEMFCKYIYE